MMNVNYIRDRFNYDPISGAFTWFKPTNNRVRIGSNAGRLMPDNSYRVSIDNKSYAVHRLIWLYMTGEFPTAIIDHIDRNPSNNKWNNLRDCSTQQNAFNQVTRSFSSKSGYPNVHHHKYGWQVKFRIKGVKRYSKFFKPCDFHAAIEHAKTKSIELYGEYSPYNKLKEIKQ